MSVPPSCLKGLEWEGTAACGIVKLAKTDAYVTGDNPDLAVLLIHDLLGWTFPNLRLLADHYAREANVTVHVPDFFNSEVLPFETLQRLRVPFDCQHFPGVEHACFVRGDLEKSGEREAMARGKNAAINWWKQFLHNV